MENNSSTIKNNPKDVFFYLLSTISFFISIIALIRLYISYISVLFPDPLMFYYTSIANSVRLSMAMLLVAFPVYILTCWFLEKEVSKNPEKRELTLRKGLIYFTLFIAAITIIIDLITFIYSFLSGEMTIHFFLKVLVILVITGVVFGYYIWELKRKEEKKNILKILAIGTSVIILTSIFAGFFIVGTPAKQRERKFDEERISDLQNIQGEVVNFWSQKNALPINQEELEDDISWFTIPKDPKTGESYEYKVVDSLTFELCATFTTSTKDFYNSESAKYINRDPFSSKQSWEHEAEKTCFTRTIDPERHKNDF